MQQHKKKDRSHFISNNIIYRITIFVLSTILIAYFFPREIQFNYSYEKGKPWQHELLTASFDFPIYKSEQQFQHETDSIKKEFQPYFKLDKQISSKQLEKLKEETYSKNRAVQESAYYDYIIKQFSEIYNRGIIPSKVNDSLKREKIETIYIKAETVFKQQPLANSYTSLSAYQQIIDQTPNYLNKEKIKSWNLHQFIRPNCFYDSLVSNKRLQTQISELSKTKGVIQKGERIIEKGEIVDTKTFAILNSMQKCSLENKVGKTNQYFLYLGQVTLIALLLGMLFAYLFLFRPELFNRRRDINFILLLIISLTILCALVVKTKLLSVYILPYSILPIILCTFHDTRTTFYTHIITVLLGALLVPNPFLFTILQITAGVIAIFNIKELTQRSQLFMTSVYVFLVYALVYTSYVLLHYGELSQIHLLMYAYFFVNAAFLLFAYLLIYIIEKFFGYISSVTLIELQNINNPLLRKLSEECPGTFQHSLQVGALAYEAARKTNANSQLVRTAAFYHDIGKLNNPAFFTENQKGANPHNQLTYEDSAKIIIAHVTDGIKLAQKNNLPEAIIHFIRTHHGKSKTRYFFNSFKNKFPEVPIDEQLFTYPGPIPFSKETAILMMADAVEASSRSLQEYNDETISNLVEMIIDSQIADGSFKNAPITFKDVERVKEIFKQRLKTIYHTRISYPTLKSE